METTQVLNGVELAAEIHRETKSFIESKKLKPKLLIFQVGSDSTSTLFVNLKKKKGEEVGIHVNVVNIPEGSEEEIYQSISSTISKLRQQVDGVMIQLPLPKGVSTQKILSTIPKELDVDGLLLQESPFPTAVAAAVAEIMQLINEVIIRSESIAILGTSAYVGGSIAQYLLQKGTEQIQLINETTSDKSFLIKSADIVISCIGKPHIYKAQDLKKGAVLIDVGTSRNSEGKIVGDFDVTAAEGHLRAYSPVPGGVGPVTVVKLLQQTALNAELLAR